MKNEKNRQWAYGLRQKQRKGKKNENKKWAWLKWAQHERKIK